MKPHIWMHKKTAKTVLAVPWFLVESDKSWDESFCRGRYSVVIAAVVRVGWLLGNCHNLYLGVNDLARNEFDDLGEL